MLFVHMQIIYLYLFGFFQNFCYAVKERVLTAVENPFLLCYTNTKMCIVKHHRW